MPRPPRTNMDLSNPTIGVAIDPAPAKAGGEAVGKEFDKIDARARRAAENTARGMKAVERAVMSLRRILGPLAVYFSVRGAIAWAHEMVDGLTEMAARAKKVGLALSENEKAALAFKESTLQASAAWRDFGEHVLGATLRTLKAIAEESKKVKPPNKFNISGRTAGEG